MNLKINVDHVKPPVPATSPPIPDEKAELPKTDGAPNKENS
jgi:hypothetical protein